MLRNFLTVAWRNLVKSGNVAEQRIREIGVRKVLGASLFNLWKLLSVDLR